MGIHFLKQKIFASLSIVIKWKCLTVYKILKAVSLRSTLAEIDRTKDANKNPQQLFSV